MGREQEEMVTTTLPRPPRESRVERVKSRFDLTEVVRSHGVALREGHRFSMGRCPFHEDDTPSFMVVPDERRYYCFGCRARGDVIDFVKQAQHLGTVKDVLDILEGPNFKAVMSATPLPPPRKPEPPRARTTAERAVLLSVAKMAYATLFKSDEGAVAREYIKSRGITEETARKLKLGYGTGTGWGLVDLLKAEGHEWGAIKGSGVIAFEKRKKDDDRPPPPPKARFAGYITVPDVAAGDVGYIAARVVDPKQVPKFQSIPGAKPVLGLTKIRQADYRWCVVTEGLFDYITLAQWRWPACAVMGAANSEQRSEQFDGFRFVFTAMDNDESGQEFTEKLVEALGEDRVAHVTLPDEVKDVGDLAVRQGGAQAFRNALGDTARQRGWRLSSLDD